jgi:hypothetical protein
LGGIESEDYFGEILMNIDDDTKRFIIYRLKWLGLYMGISLILLFLLRFPYDFISVLGLLVLVNYLRARRNIIKRYGGMSRIKDMFGSVSAPMADNNNQYRRLKYYCMNCGKEHNDIKCPNCGSKMKRVG